MEGRELANFRETSTIYFDPLVDPLQPFIYFTAFNRETRKPLQLLDFFNRYLRYLTSHR